MQKYLNQLLQDLLAAHRCETEIRPQTFEEHIQEVERFLEGEDETLGPIFGEVCGIDKEQFPPASRLNPEQIESLSNAIKKLFWTWNIALDLPDTLPLEQVYFFQVEVFDMQVMIVDSGTIHVGFCEDDFNFCVFGEAHCTCKQQWEEWEEEDRIYDAYIQQFTEDLDKKISPSAEKMKVFFSDDEVEITESEQQPIQTLAEWLDIEMEDFPDSFPLWEKRADRISEIIMRLWHPKDEMITILNALEWDKRFIALKDYLKSKVWFDGIATVYFLPLSEEEKSKYRSPLDSLGFDGDLPF
ncbi:MAG TPA: hypothetical protein ENJ53_10065 [Phaeodactylibacter sp.]|nr:hypothetical protein [Phaeodactylibacter sp.]